MCTFAAHDRPSIVSGLPLRCNAGPLQYLDLLLGQLVLQPAQGEACGGTLPTLIGKVRQRARDPPWTLPVGAWVHGALATFVYYC